MREFLRETIASGPISFANFMHHTLYEPGLGYYLNGTQKFGADGDFITAPEVSPLFGQCVAAQCRDVLAQTGGDILEVGAGTGRLASSILDALCDMPDFNYFILEPSADLQQRQQQFLASSVAASVVHRVHWINNLPVSFTGVIVANEVMDALPVERFCIAEELMQVAVDYTEDRLVEVQIPASADVVNAVGTIEEDIGFTLPVDYVSEVNLLLAPWISSLADCLSCGVVLLADYGYPRSEYYLPERVSGTLMCYYQHRGHTDACWYPGLQDITAHVDFTQVAECASASGFELLGYTTQAAFLMALGLLDLAAAESAQCDQEIERVRIAQAVKTLTLPGEMGERFQVMALGKKCDFELRGFSMYELSHRL